MGIVFDQSLSTSDNVEFNGLDLGAAGSYGDVGHDGMINNIRFRGGAGTGFGDIISGGTYSLKDFDIEGPNNQVITMENNGNMLFKMGGQNILGTTTGEVLAYKSINPADNARDLGSIGASGS